VRNAKIETRPAWPLLQKSLLCGLRYFPLCKGYVMSESSGNEQNLSGNMGGDSQALRERAGAAKEAVKDLASEAGRYASRRMSDARDTASHWAKNAKNKAMTYGEVVGDYVQENPYKCIAIAAGAGLLLGLLLKRR
jgi:ElaB/YqjD/DUF883 family membrane-anchored ribosome-binding protein